MNDWGELAHEGMRPNLCEGHRNEAGETLRGDFFITSREDAKQLAIGLAEYCGNIPEIALGLTELLVNGVEHGCLAIGGEVKRRLVLSEGLNEEVSRRMVDPTYRGRGVRLVFLVGDNHFHFVVSDPGCGFNHDHYMVTDSACPPLPLTPGEGPSGNGIQVAKACFERLHYEGKGNKVHAYYPKTDPLSRVA